MKRGFPMGWLAESFVCGLVSFHNRVGLREGQSAWQIRRFVDATDLNELQRLRATNLLELSFDLAIAGRQFDAARAAESAFPVDSSARLRVHAPKAIPYERAPKAARKRKARRATR
jgi:hypothetical protein